MAINYHAQIKDMFNGGGSSASSTTGLTATFESLASDTRELLKRSSVHYDALEKLLKEQTKAIKKIKSDDGLSLSDRFRAKYLNKYMGRFGKVLSGIFGRLPKGGLLAGAFGVLKGVARDSLSQVTGILGYGKDIAGAVVKPFAMIRDTVMAAGRPIMKAASIVTRMFEGIGFAKVFGKLGGTLARVGGKIAMIGGKLLTKVVAWPITLMFGLYDAVTGWMNSDKLLGRESSGVWDKIKSAAGSVVNGILLGIPDYISSFFGFENFVQTLDAGDQYVRKMSGVLYDKIGEIGSGLVDWTTDMFGNLVQTIKDGVTNMFSNMGSAISNWWNGDASPPPTVGRRGAPVSPADVKYKEPSTSRGVPVVMTGAPAQSPAVAVNQTDAAIRANMPNEVIPYFDFMKNAMTRAAYALVKTYADLQGKVTDAELEKLEDDNPNTRSINILNGSLPSPSNDNSIFGGSGGYVGGGMGGGGGGYTGSDGSAIPQSSPTGTMTPSAPQVSPLQPLGGKPSSIADWNDNLPEDQKMAITKRELKKRFPNATNAQIDGIIGNMVGESDLRSNINEKGGGGGYGLIQWTDGRRRNLERYAAEVGKSPDDAGVQHGFLFEEATNPRWGEKSFYDRYFETTRNMTPEQAAMSFANIVERPDRLALQSSAGKRMSAARRSAGIAPAVEPISAVTPSPTIAGGYATPNALMNGPFPNVSQIQNGIRKMPIQKQLEADLSEMAYRTFGEGYKVSVYSGGQPQEGGGPRTGSIRHDLGNAADVTIIGPDGKQISQEQYAKMTQAWIASGKGSAGMQMTGGGVHFDNWTKDKLKKGMALSWDYDENGIPLSKIARQAMRNGVNGVMPDNIRSQSEYQNWLAKQRGGQTPTSSEGLGKSNPYRVLPDLSTQPTASDVSVQRPIPSSIPKTATQPPVIPSPPPLPQNVTASGGAAQQAAAQSAGSQSASSNAPRETRVADIAPLDEFKMVLAIGSAFMG